MHIEKTSLLTAAFFGLLLFSACKKEVSDTTPDPGPGPDSTAGTSEADKIKDTTLAYARDIYLWYDQIPASFNARSYSGPDKIMTAIRQYSNEPGFSKPVDRWSFAMKQKDWDNVSSGIAGDFGLDIFFRDETDLRIKSVEAASPAGQAGIRRGWRITKVGGSSNINTDDAAIEFIVDKVFYSNSTSFTFEKPDGTSVDVTLNAATYQQDPIFLDTVYNINGNKIGYFVFNSFLGDTAQIYNSFSNIFSNFAAQQVGDVVVDLRYNGGGYVSMQERLANYLAPQAASGDLMMEQQFNDKYAADFNERENFRKLGALNLSRIFFIVSKSTASASELLINNLKPYMDVQLLGPSKSYGKPVGYFPIPVGDWYIFPVSFRTTNKNGEGSYFDGLPLNKQVADGLDKDWGDLNESCLASVVNYITTGTYTMSAGRTMIREKPEVLNGNEVLDAPSFKGAIDTRRMR